MQLPPIPRVSAWLAQLVVVSLLVASCAISTDGLENVTMSDGTPATAPTPSASTGDVPETQGDPPTTPATETDGDDDTPPATTDPAPDADLTTIGSDGAGDRYYPTYGNGGYDVELYDLRLNWDHDTREIDGEAVITMTALQELSQFNFDLVGFDVTAIDVNGEPASFDRDGRELIIRPATALELDEVATVSIQYDGRPTLLDSIGAPFSTGWTDFGDTTVVAGEPEGAAGWYPVNEHPIDKATYRIELTASDDLVVAANGTQTSVTDNGDTKTWVYESVNPQASYLTTVAIGDFIRHEGAPSASGVPVRHYFHSTVFDQGVATMERTGEMIDAFENVFGPYPFENYGSVVVDADLGFALETQTLSVFGRDPRRLVRQPRRHRGPRTRPPMVWERHQPRPMVRHLAQRRFRHLQRVPLARGQRAWLRYRRRSPR